MAAQSFRAETARPKSAQQQDQQSSFMMLPSVQMIAEDVVAADDSDEYELDQNGMPKCWIRVPSAYVRRVKQTRVQQKLRALEDPYSSSNRKLNNEIVNLFLQPLQQAQTAREVSEDKQSTRERTAGRRPTSSITVAQGNGAAKSAVQRFPVRGFFSTDGAYGGKKKNGILENLNIPPEFWDDFMQDFKFYKRPKPKVKAVPQNEQSAESNGEQSAQQGNSVRPRTGKHVQFTSQEGNFTLAQRNLIDDFAITPKDSRPRSAVSTANASSRTSGGQDYGASQVLCANTNALVALNSTIKVTRYPPTGTEQHKFARIYKNAGVSADVLSTAAPNVIELPHNPSYSRPVSASSCYSRATDFHPLDTDRLSIVSAIAATEPRTRPSSVRVTRPSPPRRRPRSALKQNVEYLPFWRGAARDAPFVYEDD